MNEIAIVKAALRIEDPIERRAFIEGVCLGNDELLLRVEAKLKELGHHELESPTKSEFTHTTDFSIDTIKDQSNGGPPSSDEDPMESIDFRFLKPSDHPNSLGSLGHYEVLQVLGQGGFGVVLKAFDVKLHRTVAIKIMSPQMAMTSPPRKRFLREARSAAGVKHDNVVAVYAVEEQPLPYLVMEYVDGVTLQHKLDEKGPLEVSEILHLGRQMANGLAAAHDVGLVHRDIKPGNILIESGAEQKIKITDFGLARLVDDASTTRTGLISGTPLYMAPEQAMGSSLDHRTDLFSLGSVLYQMASGRPPFRAPTAIAVLRRVAEDTPRPLSEIIPELPHWLEAVVDRLLEKKPEDRFQSAKEVAELFGRFQNELQFHGDVIPKEIRRSAKSKKGSSKKGGHLWKVLSSKSKGRMSLISAAIGVLLLMLALSQAISYQRKPQGLPEEIPTSSKKETNPFSYDESHWISLLDGDEKSNWRTMGPFRFVDGLLVANGGGSNAISKEEFGDFELEAEWKIGPNGNSGIYYREGATSAIGPGNEYQLLDDEQYADKQPPNMQTGSLYGMMAPNKANAKPIGEWNQTRILCIGSQVEHWLNGEKILAYDTASPKWKANLDASKWIGKEKVANRSKGHLLLQGHTGEIAFRSLRVREIRLTNKGSSIVASTESARSPVKVLPPILGGDSLVPRPEFIEGLRSWGIVRSYPSGLFLGAARMVDGKMLTCCNGSPCLFVHSDRWEFERVILPPLIGEHPDGFNMRTNLALAPRSGRVAFVNPSYEICVMDLTTEQIIWHAPKKRSSESIEIGFSHSEKRLGFAGNGILSVFDLEPKGTTRSIDLSEGKGDSPRKMVWSPDDQELWVVGRNGIFSAYSTIDLKEIRDHSLSSRRIANLAISPDKTEVAVVSIDGHVEVLRIADWIPQVSWKLSPSKETECEWSPDQKHIAIGGSNRLEVWNRSTKTKVHEAAGGGRLVWNGEGSQVARLKNHVESATIDLLSGKDFPIRFGPIAQNYYSAAFSPDGKRSIGCQKGEVAYFEDAIRKNDWRIKNGLDRAVFSNRSDRVAFLFGWETPTTKIFGISEQDERLTLRGYGPSWSPDDSMIATIENPNQVVISDSKNGKELQRFEVGLGGRIKTSWSPDGRYLAVRIGSEVPQVHIWDRSKAILATYRDFPSSYEENLPMLAPTWRSNDVVMMPFSNHVYEIAMDSKTNPVSRINVPNNILSVAHDRVSNRTVVSIHRHLSIHDPSGKEIYQLPSIVYESIQWLPDGRRFLTNSYHHYEIPARGYDADRREPLGCFFPCLGPEGWLTIGPTGHYRGSVGIESEFSYVALYENGRQRAYAASEFAKTFGWKNDPKQATFLEFVETEKVVP